MSITNYSFGEYKVQLETNHDFIRVVLEDRAYKFEATLKPSMDTLTESIEDLNDLLNSVFSGQIESSVKLVKEEPYDLLTLHLYFEVPYGIRKTRKISLEFSNIPMNKIEVLENRVQYLEEKVRELESSLRDCNSDYVIFRDLIIPCDIPNLTLRSKLMNAEKSLFSSSMYIHDPEVSKKYRSLKFLTKLNNLKSFSIYCDEQIKLDNFEDYHYISCLKKLESLSLHCCSNLDNLDFLKDLANLKLLRFNYKPETSILNEENILLILKTLPIRSGPLEIHISNNIKSKKLILENGVTKYTTS